MAELTSMENSQQLADKDKIALTPREQEIFEQLLAGKSPKEIAHIFNVSNDTILAHQKNLYRKLDVHSINELLTKYSNNEKAFEQSAKTSVSVIKKHNKFKLLHPVVTAILAFSVLLIWIFLIKSPVYSAKTEVKIPVHNMGFYPTYDKMNGGNSTGEIYFTVEEIDGMEINVLNLNTNLVINENKDLLYAKAITLQNDIIQLLRKADGIRFKARGDGKLWNIEFHTSITYSDGRSINYNYLLRTLKDQVIVVDIPYSSLYQMEFNMQELVDFKKETISILSITADLHQGYGSSLIQIFDFEIY